MRSFCATVYNIKHQAPGTKKTRHVSATCHADARAFRQLLASQSMSGNSLWIARRLDGSVNIATPLRTWRPMNHSIPGRSNRPISSMKRAGRLWWPNCLPLKCITETLSLRIRAARTWGWPLVSTLKVRETIPRLVKMPKRQNTLVVYTNPNLSSFSCRIAVRLFNAYIIYLCIPVYKFWHTLAF